VLDILGQRCGQQEHKPCVAAVEQLGVNVSFGVMGCVGDVADFLPQQVQEVAANIVCQLNNTFYRRFYLDDEPLAVTDDELTPPFAEIQDAHAAYQHYKQLTIGQRSKEPALPEASENVTPITNRRPGRNA
jgi:hypothetical protein